MKARIAVVTVSLIVFGALSSSQIQYPGRPLSNGFELTHDVQTLTMPPVDVEALLAEDRADAERKDVPYRFGYPWWMSESPTQERGIPSSVGIKYGAFESCQRAPFRLTSSSISSFFPLGVRCLYIARTRAW